ncbi:EamA family transporter RarD [Undibacterium sp.]|uniref:EamA family transporter RarD n=1 Tax=Undibacterium sp. TaxID=1914977 RepID=UPI0025EBE9DC|nr:EamA family transporter RarD [Undibacterium sp.]
MRKGILYAAVCYSAWGLFPIYFKALHEITPIEILLYRMLFSLVFLLAILSWRNQWAWVRLVLRTPKLIAGFGASALLLSINWFIYIWAINNGRVIDASLGYFITPLVSVLLGYAFLHERLRRLQSVALGFAAAGVAWLAWQTGHPPWIGLALALSFGTYGLLRKTAALGALEGLSLETALLFPFALGYLLWLSDQGQTSYLTSSDSARWLLLAAGPITAIPLLLFATAARRIPMATLGVLQYISPTIQLILGVYLYNESFGSARLMGFLAIWLGLALYSFEGIRNTYLARK